jgi:hypothetical protein
LVGLDGDPDLERRVVSRQAAGGQAETPCPLIDDGPALAEHVAAFLDLDNTRRPHKALDFQLPLDRYLRPPSLGRHGLVIGPCS